MRSAEFRDALSNVFFNVGDGSGCRRSHVLILHQLAAVDAVDNDPRTFGRIIDPKKIFTQMSGLRGHDGELGSRRQLAKQSRRQEQAGHRHRYINRCSHRRLMPHSVAAVPGYCDGSAIDQPPRSCNIGFLESGIAGDDLLRPSADRDSDHEPNVRSFDNFVQPQ